MAGDWIPLEYETPRKAEVLRIARLSGMSRLEVIGALVEFWCWVAQETVDGRVDADVDALVDLFGFPKKFWDAVLEVEWLTKADGSLEIPNADHWLTNGAKARLGKARRQSKWRASTGPSTKTSTKTSTRASTGASTKTSTREEKRRGIHPTGVRRAAKPRPPDPIWDTVCDIWGLTPKAKSDRTRIGRIVSNLKAKGATADEIRRRRDLYVAEWPKAECTPEALDKHWARFESSKAEDEYDRIMRENPPPEQP